jgi:hypothetical protein
MFKADDPWSSTFTGVLHDNSVQRKKVGSFFARLRVTHYDDVQLPKSLDQSGVSSDGSRKYILDCVQRISVINSNGYSISPSKDINSLYVNYPVMLKTSISVKSPPEESANPGISIEFIGHSPQTVNTQVQTSGSTGASSGQTNSVSASSTVGSSMSQTNSYGWSLGTFGLALTSGISSEHSTTSAQEYSSTTGHESAASRSHEASSASSMSIKDWGAYSLIDPVQASPTWVFGQEYPWDAITCRQIISDSRDGGDNRVQVLLPSAMAARLYDQQAIQAPSHLSMFGYSFLMSAQWLITVPRQMTGKVSVEHLISHFTAAHMLKGGLVAVFIDQQPASLTIGEADSITNSLDLGIQALDPLGTRTSAAVVGFVPSKFTAVPCAAGAQSAPTPFSIFSTSNALLLRDTTSYPSPCPNGAGFSAGQTALQATFMNGCTTLSFKLFFKVTKPGTEYVLHFKHWKTAEPDIKMTFVFNGDSATKITKYVDAFEAEGGEGNMLTIALRNLDFSSVDYTDLLIPGLNVIEVTLSSTSGSSGGYALRALAIQEV